MWIAKSRILAIFGIVALGVGFLFGMISTAPDMYITADNYFNSARLYDIHIRSSYGFTEADISAAADTDGVLVAAGAYEADAIVSEGADTYVARFHSIPATESAVNDLMLSEGRMPERADECVVDVGAVMAGGSIEIGDVLVFADKESGDEFTVSELEVVGKVKSALYASAEKGSSDKGSGVVEAIIHADASAFASEVYTELYIRSDISEGLMSFGEEYGEMTDSLAEKLESSLSERCEQRFYEVKSSAEEILSEGKALAATLRAEYEGKTARKSEVYREYLRYYNALVSLKNGDTYEGMNQSQLSERVELLRREYELVNEAVSMLGIKLSAADKAIADGEARIASLKETQLYFYDRYDNEAFNSFKINAEKMNDIAVVFPIFFFLVALLVSLTTMTRMVEEERTVIGTMKALGYSSGAVAFKYIFYALSAGALGSVLGLAVGGAALPTVIYKAYSILYSIPSLELHFNVGYAAIASLTMVLGTVVATYIAVRATLAEAPAALLRHKAQPEGKRILLERVTSVWRKMSFGGKVTARNLFLYKKRFFMTLIGVAGCMALLLTGFGLRDSVGSVVELQYEYIYKYDTAIVRYGDSHAEEFENRLSSGGVEDCVWISMASAEVSSRFSDQSVTAYVTVPEKAEETDKVINFVDADTEEPIEMGADSVFITEKMADILNVGAGDEVSLMLGDGEHSFTVDAVVENYINSYAYIGSGIYADTVGSEPEYSVVLGISGERAPTERDKLSAALLSDPKTMSVDYTDSNAERFEEIVSKLNYVVGILIIAAAALAFVVLYNLINVNISERRREIATVKVLGFYDRETDAYVFRETYILTLLGSLVGIAVGIALHSFVVRTIEMELAMFRHVIYPTSYIFSIALTLAFSALVTLIMKRRLRGIDMVESLKSAE